MIYDPGRLLIHNFYVCCECDIETLLDKLNDQIILEIQSLIAEAKDHLSNRSISETEASILPHSFKIFANKQRQLLERFNEKFEMANAYPKSQDYCLFQYLDKAQAMVNHINHNFATYRTKNSSDIKAIEEFEKCLNFFAEASGATSNKSLKRILTISSQGFDRKQEKVARYLLSRVFPHMTIQADTTFLAGIKRIAWQKIVTVDLGATRSSSSIENIVQNEYFDKLKSHFDELFKLNDSSFDEIGEKLIEINIALREYCETTISDSSTNKNQFNDSSHPANIKETFNATEVYTYDATISSHIVSFMKWIPMIDGDSQNIELIQAIESIIELIRAPLIEAINEKGRLKEFLEDKNCWFLAEENLGLRKLLIQTLHNEPYIHSEFHDYYGVSMPAC